MDSRRFDNWTRNRAMRLSRRDTLRLAAAGGISTALATHSPRVLAQSPCSLLLHGNTIGGPSANTAYDGILQFTLGPDGTFTQASFTPTGGVPNSATGMFVGHAFDVLIELGEGGVLTLSGATGQADSICPTVAAGMLTGPQPGDLGAWQASKSTNPGGAVSTGSTNTGTGSSGNTSSSSTNCPPPQTVCGQNCCAGGALCTDVNQGLCSCPNGTEQCGNQCIASCSDGQSVDLDTCSCPPPETACIQNQQSCQNHGQCCSGYCGGGTCFDCAGKVCGDFGCIDPNKDSQNCGNCGNTCVYPKVCSGGVCGCAPDATPCVDHAECCSQLCFVNTCVSCSNVTGNDGVSLTFCAAGVCVDTRIDIDHCGGCFNACPRTSGGIVCDSGVCHDINNDADYCGFSGQPCPSGQICRFGYCVNA